MTNTTIEVMFKEYTLSDLCIENNTEFVKDMSSNVKIRSVEELISLLNSMRIKAINVFCEDISNVSHVRLQYLNSNYILHVYLKNISVKIMTLMKARESSLSESWLMGNVLGDYSRVNNYYCNTSIILLALFIYHSSPNTYTIRVESVNKSKFNIDVYFKIYPSAKIDINISKIEQYNKDALTTLLLSWRLDDGSTNMKVLEIYSKDLELVNYVMSVIAERLGFSYVIDKAKYRVVIPKKYRDTIIKEFLNISGKLGIYELLINISKWRNLVMRFNEKFMRRVTEGLDNQRIKKRVLSVDTTKVQTLNLLGHEFKIYS